jgi:hypothetical protein
MLFLRHKKLKSNFTDFLKTRLESMWFYNLYFKHPSVGKDYKK